MNRIIEALRNKDDKQAYALAKEIEAKSAVSDEYYSRFEEFASLISDKSSYVRTRGFVLCCAQARWDTQGKLKKAFPAMLALLHDEKPTVVRQCLAALHEAASCRPELCGIIRLEVSHIDLTRYKDSMAPLIKKDIDKLLEAMGSITP